nr:hypothetical protein [Candidatus Sigynarchaeota archaeon]
MAIEPLINKLNQNLKTAQETLRSQFLSKIEELSLHPDKFSSTDLLKEELEGLVEDFISSTSVEFQDLISYLETELPELASQPAPVKPKEKKPREKKQMDPEKPEFVRPTFVHRAFVDEGLRVSKEARPMLIDILNETIKKDIDRIKQQLPVFSKGEKEGEKKRITIKPEDVTREKLAPSAPAASAPGETKVGFERELEAIPLDVHENKFKIAIVVREQS